MRQVLFRIPLNGPWHVGPFDLPGFGFGIVLGLWVVLGLWWAFRAYRSGNLTREAVTPAILWLIVAAVIVGLPTMVKPGASVPVYGYGFMLFLGFLAAGWTGARRAVRAGYDAALVWDVAMWTFFAGIVGARIFYLIEYRRAVFGNAPTLGAKLRAAVDLPSGGIVLYGGVILALIVYFIFCRVRRVRPLVLADLIIPSFFLALAFGRVGCFLNGCCFGDPCQLPWGVSFPQGSVPFAVMVERGSISPQAEATPPLHPTQLYSAANALVLSLLTAWYYRRRHRDGDVLSLALLVYPVTRFALEIVRGDEPAQFGTMLTISQWVSIGIFLFAVAFRVWLIRHGGTASPTAVSADGQGYATLPAKPETCSR